VPDEIDAGPAKRGAMRSVARDRDLNGKIQEGIVVGGRTELSPMMAGESEEVAAMSPNADGETAVEESEASEYSRSMRDDDEESMDPFASSGEDEDEDEEGGAHSEDEGKYAEEETPSIGEFTGANAMLTDMPDENNTTLAKRRAIQSVMQDRGFSAVERNRKIQDIMAGRDR